MGMDMSGKWSLGDTSSIFSSFSDSLVVDGILGIDGSFPLWGLNGSSLAI
jgi:hypothetical protein